MAAFQNHFLLPFSIAVFKEKAACKFHGFKQQAGCPVISLRETEETLQSSAMKLALAVLVYLIMAAILGAGIFLAATGKPLFLVIAFAAFVVAFGRLGCMPH
jgi:hypothetical protein